MCRIVRTFVRGFGFLLFALLVLGSNQARAHQNPPLCTGNNLGLDILKDKTFITSGDTVTYTVNVRNDAAGACDITNATVTGTCPAPGTGTPTGTTTTLASGANFAAGFP